MKIVKVKFAIPQFLLMATLYVENGQVIKVKGIIGQSRLPLQLLPPDGFEGNDNRLDPIYIVSNAGLGLKVNEVDGSSLYYNIYSNWAGIDGALRFNQIDICSSPQDLSNLTTLTALLL